ncbi:MAG: flagellar assembly protein FliX [Alphaproteobacteria bacterium]|nr:flagellar assembly protein FliX [Alphaproteobacteria bacterium SS10]
MSVDRIGKTGSVTTGATRKAKKSADGAGFSRLIDGGEDEAVAGAATQSCVSGVGGIDAILALQQVDPDGARKPRHQAVVRGEKILGALEGLRDDILLGRVSAGTMQQLTNFVEDAREETDDPELTAVLDEIDLRAQVELAKLEMARKGRG